MIARDVNQSIELKAVQAFFNSIEAFDMHHKCNNIELKQLDNASSSRSKPIDVVVVSRGLIEFIEESLRNECNEIMFADCRSYMVDINFKAYFD